MEQKSKSNDDFFGLGHERESWTFGKGGILKDSTDLVRDREKEKKGKMKEKVEKK